MDLESRTLPPVHFSVRADSDKATEIVARLHRFALGANFLSVSDRIRLTGEQCAVEENDPLATFKIKARGLFVEQKLVCSYMADIVDGFQALMPNGNNFDLAIGTFPESIEIMPGKIILPLPDGISEAKTFVHTVRLNQNQTVQCVESHRVVMAVLKEASHLGCEVSVQDPYNQWCLPFSVSIGRALKHAQGLACVAH